MGTLGTLAILWLAGGTCSALSCYNCGWSASRCQTRGELTAEDPPPYPLADTCIGNSSHPPDKATVAKSCRREQCLGKDQACMSWTFLTGNPENITFMCVGNPGSRTGCYNIEIPHGDKEKKYNTKTQRVEVCLCDDKDFCNSGANCASFVILLAVTSVWLSSGARHCYS